MTGFAVGQTVRVILPKGKNKRGVPGVSVMYTTSMEARFEGAVGTVTEINPRGPYGWPIYLVDFRGHNNRTALPWLAHWFREEWLNAMEAVPAREVRADRAAAAATPPSERAPVAGPTGTVP